MHRIGEGAITRRLQRCHTVAARTTICGITPRLAADEPARRFRCGEEQSAPLSERAA